MKRNGFVSVPWLSIPSFLSSLPLFSFPSFHPTANDFRINGSPLSRENSNDARSIGFFRSLNVILRGVDRSGGSPSQRPGGRYRWPVKGPAISDNMDRPTFACGH